MTSSLACRLMSKLGPYSRSTFNDPGSSSLQESSQQSPLVWLGHGERPVQQVGRNRQVAVVVGGELEAALGRTAQPRVGKEVFTAPGSVPRDAAFIYALCADVQLWDVIHAQAMHLRTQSTQDRPQ
jgi:hypothetical protein